MKFPVVIVACFALLHHFAVGCGEHAHVQPRIVTHAHSTCPHCKHSARSEDPIPTERQESPQPKSCHCAGPACAAIEVSRLSFSPIESLSEATNIDRAGGCNHPTDHHAIDSLAHALIMSRPAFFAGSRCAHFLN